MKFRIVETLLVDTLRTTWYHGGVFEASEEEAEKRLAATEVIGGGQVELRKVGDDGKGDKENGPKDVKGVTKRRKHRGEGK